MLRQPEFVTETMFAQAKEVLSKKKPRLDLSPAMLIKYAEGLCAQVMHIGSYDTEAETIAMLDAYIRESGFQPDFSEQRRHHEIYLSDPRKTAVEKRKTVIRHPMRKKG